MTRKPVLIVLHGPSGVGKDTVIDALRQRIDIRRPTSSTDRPRRDYEVDGVHYHFLSTQEFERKIARGDFIEYSIVYNQWKGVERAEVEPLLEQGHDIIIRTNVDGARAWRKRVEGAVYVFLTAEDPDALRRRLHKRRSETPETLLIRIAEFDAEMADLPNNDYVVVNHTGRVQETVAELEAIIERERANPERPWPRLRPDA